MRALLTIDDAPSPDFPALLDLLSEQGIKAIFFCTGQQMASQRPHLVRALSEGHQLGNHAWDHRAFSELSLPECLRQIEDTELLLLDVRNEANCSHHAKIFRFPYGDKGLGVGKWQTFSGRFQYKTRYLQKYLQRRGYKSPADLGFSLPRLGFPEMLTQNDIDWLWGGDSQDWAFRNSGKTPQEFAQEVLARLPIILEEDKNEVLLFHDHPGNLALFREILPELRPSLSA